MNFSDISFAARSIGATVVIAAIALAGCNQNTSSAESAPAPATSAEYPVSTPAAESPAPAGAASIKVSVSLSKAVAGKAAPNDVVFVYARAAQGPRMPLAIVRMQVKDLPTTVVLDDNHSMSPQLKLSAAPEVVVVARVSKSGNAVPEPGDLEGVSGTMKPGNQAIALSIAKVVGAR